MTISPVIAQMQNRGLEIVKQAEFLYIQGKWQAAVNKWRQADDYYQQQDDKLNRSMVLSNLALTYQQLGDWQKSQSSLSQSFNILNRLKNTTEKQRLLANTFDIQGKHDFTIGKTDKALQSWNQAGKIYPQIGETELLFTNQVNQAQAMQRLGFYPRSCKTLLRSFQINSQKCTFPDEQLTNLATKIRQQKNQQVKFSQVKGLHILGNAFRGMGDLEISQKVLQTTSEIVENSFPEYAGNVLLSLGNTEIGLCQENKDKFCKKAQIFYQTAATKTGNKDIQIQAILNYIDLSQNTSQIAKFEKLIADLNLNQAKIDAEIKLTEYQFCQGKKELNCLRQSEEINYRESWNKDLVSQTVQKLINIGKDAEKIGYQRSQSYTLLMIGRVYEKTGNLQKAREYTQAGLKIAHKINAVDLSYQIQWQLGRVLIQENQKPQARIAYTNSFNNLQTLRNDLVSLNPDMQYDFRDSVEPVYRQYVDLLLQDNPSQEDLKQAREVIESLQLAELENFFRDACIEDNTVDIDKFVNQSVEQNSPTAIFYTIILKQRLEVIVTLPGKPLLHYTTDIDEKKLKEKLQELQKLVKNPLRDPNLFTLSNQFYKWLFAKAESKLIENQIQTVVFVLDGYLRNIPMAALDDGKKYLVEKYAIAYSPGLKLLQPQQFKQPSIITLSAGLSTDQAPSILNYKQRLSSLPSVNQELDAIDNLFSGEQLRNQEFTKNKFQIKVSQTNAKIIHLATHGKFSSKAKDTLIFAWDDTIDINELQQLLRNRDLSESENIELLVLSACQTAEGDNRATLGLAGVAVRSGARGTLATLWQVNDNSTFLLMEKFYQELINNPNLTKAQALQKAQLYILTKNLYHIIGLVLF